MVDTTSQGQSRHVKEKQAIAVGECTGKYVHQFLCMYNSTRKVQGTEQACQMVCFQNKNLNLGKFWRASDLKMIIYIPICIYIYGHLDFLMEILDIY
jgi:hypothetical protein